MTVRITCPTESLSPSLTRTPVTLPATGDGMGATAFSFSSSRIVWPLVIVSPSLTIIPTTVPDSAPSPNLGNLTSINLTGSLECRKSHRVLILNNQTVTRDDRIGVGLPACNFDLR